MIFTILLTKKLSFLRFIFLLVLISSFQTLVAQSPGGVSTGLELWLKADTGFTYNSITDAEWLDQSTNVLVLNSNLVQGPDSDSAPTFLANHTNFNPAIVFDGVDNGLATALNAANFNFSETTAFSVQQVLANTTSESNAIWHYGATGGNDFALFAYPDDYGFHVALTGGLTIEVTNDILNNDLPNLFGFTGNSSSTELYVNDKEIATSTAMATLPGNGSILIGLDADGTQAQDGDNHLEGAIGEIIMFDRKLSTTEQQQVNSYLALKYGLSLDQIIATDYIASDGTTVIWDASGNTGYTNNILGIGRDDDSGLDQKVSKSVNQDAILTIALDADFTSENGDVSRTTTHTNDKQFVMVAHNGATTTTQNTEILDAASGLNLRLAREWKIDATNFNQSVSVKFEGFDETWTVIATVDGDFSSNVEIVGSLNADGELTTPNPPADGTVFTLAKFQKAPGGVTNGIALWISSDQQVFSDLGSTNAANNDEIVLWNDQSSNNNHFTQTNPEKPIYLDNSINFNPQSYFDGTQAMDALSITGMPSGSNARLMRVVATQTAAFTSNHVPFGHGIETDGQANVFAGSSTNNSLIYGSWGAVNDVTSTTFWELDVPHIIGGGYDGVSTTYLQADGATLVSDADGAPPTWNTVNTRMRIGADMALITGQFWTGNIAEVIVYDADITGAEQQKIDSYLALKYGIALDQTASNDYLASNGATIWSATNNVGYATAIFGIGRDDASGLNQKVATSMNTDAILIAALDADFTVANTDASRTTVHTNDKQFMFLANNNGAITTQTTEIDATAFGARITREWKVDKTANFTQNINLKFDGFDETWELLKDSDGDFSAGASSLGTLDANGEISGVSLEDGDYLTLHTNNTTPTILSFEPKLAGKGETVTIIGNGFSGATAVAFGDTQASSFTVVSGTEITAVVDTGASGAITVTNAQGSDTEVGFIYKVAQYDFENDALDATDNDYDGTAINAVTYDTGAQGQAICFDNGPGYVKLPDNLISSLSEFTISLRFKTTGTGSILGYQNVESLSGSPSEWIPILLITSDGKLKGTLWTGTGGAIQAISANVVNDGNWHQVDFVADTNTVAIYLDGNLEASKSGDAVVHLSMNYNQLGLSYSQAYNTPANTTWEYFEGCIDDMVIIDRALTALEIEEVTALPEPTIASFTPTEAGEEDTVVITGTNFEGATQVTLGGIDVTSYTIDSATQITAVSGTGATGNVTVTTAGGTATANGFTFIADSFSLSETTLTLDENGGTATFTVVLDTEPSSDVVFDVSSEDTDEATVNIGQLTFTTANWNTPQTVTVTGVNDAFDRDDSATITIAVDDDNSDNPYDALDDQTVVITVTDDDTTGYTLSETALTVAEYAGTATFTVVLDSEPISDVVFDISSDAIAEATVSPAQLTFTAANWSVPQTITITGVDDNDIGNDTATITIAVNDADSDDAYDTLDNQTVAVTLTDGDEIDPVLVLTGDANRATGVANCVYTVDGTEFDPSTATDNSGSLASLTYSLQELAPNPNLVSEDFNSGSWDANNFELGTNTGSVVDGTYKSDTSSRGTLRTVAEFVPSLENPLYVSATLRFSSGEAIAFVGTRSTGEQPSGQFNAEPVGLNLRIHNFNNGQTGNSTGFDLSPRPGNAFYTNAVRFEIIDYGATVNVTMTNLVTDVSHAFTFNSNYSSGSNRVVFAGGNSASWDDIQISIGAHAIVQEYQTGSNTLDGSTLNLGENTIVWTATDAEGNEVNESQIITVADTYDPIVVTQNISVTLDHNGEATITAAEINNNSTDNCGIDTMTLDKQNFTASDTGENTVTLTVTDVNGNSDSETAVVTVINTDVNNDGLHDDAFVTTWKTDNDGTSNSTSINIPIQGSGHSYDVDWDGDGIFDEFGLSGVATHDYGTAGTYTVQLKGDFSRIYFSGSNDDSDKLLSIEQWGNIAWTSMNNAFYGCANLQGNTSDVPDLSNVTDMSYMFTGATNFNQDLNAWDVSKVTDMSYMFWLARNFNGDISSWNVSAVTTMAHMFHLANDFNTDLSTWNVTAVKSMSNMFFGATSFNQDIGGWTVAAVTNMTNMFRSAVNFNQDLSNWNVSAVKDMSFMFNLARVFNQDISGWNVSEVTTMANMFNGNFAFNQDISSWNVAKVTNMQSMFEDTHNFNSDISGWEVSLVTNMAKMFKEATQFDQNLGAWDISSVTSMGDMFTDAGLSIANYDSLLNGWSTLDSGETHIPTTIAFDAGSSQYCAGETAKSSLVTDFGWIITDSGKYCDTDLDGILDEVDNCILIANADQVDTDSDGEGDVCDTDDDGDGTLDTEDAFPLDEDEDSDTDGNGTGNNADTDDDGDGTPDSEDAFPLDEDEDTDTDGDGTGDNEDLDDDNDGTPDTEDDFPLDKDEDTDTNGDGTGDYADTDDDGDGTPDSEDAFPLDEDEDTDTDGDGTGDNADTDDDGDGTPDSEDAFPLDENEDTDTDGDGTGDNEDTDDDGDGIPDSQDPDSDQLDTDGDGTPDIQDTDDDDDGTPDTEDAFPLNGDEDTDFDGDGAGDNEDDDDDNDGLSDAQDPDDNNSDTDGDDIPDGQDADVDGDGIVDNGNDSDGDGINDANDTIDDTADADGDGVPDNEDAFPNDATESVDFDGDGIGANTDQDDNDARVGEKRSVLSAEAFTPNGDGINDTWVIKGIENYPNAVVSVYNRYGHEVFKTIGYRNDWSGRYGSKSENLPPGSYYYVVNLRNGSTPIDGWIFINY
ncbi:BspA family leucine-rich repeat surface protein [Kriegella aquimaris]|uniref:BspA family leucine-rich repeat surface protein n=1 Tax=Kriegella aquimaris TaxID=192904 RepID=UPI000AE649CA|nr:BspA family leucine-rich repeat surface protein [Kriegella aquimaris]